MYNYFLLYCIMDIQTRQLLYNLTKELKTLPVDSKEFKYLSLKINDIRKGKAPNA